MTSTATPPARPTSEEPAGWEPELPPGSVVPLAGRGSTFVRLARNQGGGPTLVLLHGLTSNADLGWFAAYPALAAHDVIALDQRGHGDGIVDRHILLQTCADDVAALLRELEINRAVLVGYSMGGAVAQLVWRRHRSKVAGLVLAATAARFPALRAQRLIWAGMGAASPLLARVQPALDDLAVKRAQRGAPPSARQAWAQAQLRRNDPLALLSARRSLASFSSLAWSGDIDVPVSFVATSRDQVVPIDRQRELIGLLRDVEVETIDTSHGAFVEDPDLFAPALARACASVVARAAS